MAAEDLVSSELAMKAIENAQNNLGDLIVNLNLYLTIAGGLFALFAIMISLYIGQDGNKTKEELKEKLSAYEGVLNAKLDDVSSSVEGISKRADREREAARLALIERFGDLEKRVDATLSQFASSVQESQSKLSDNVRSEVFSTINLVPGYAEQVDKAKSELKTILSDAGVQIAAAKEAAAAMDKQKPKDDPQYCYAYLESLPNHFEAGDDAQKRNRQVGRNHAETIIEFGEKGEVDATLLFNAGQECSRKDFDLEALKLFTLSSTFDGSKTHELARLRMEMAIGVRFKLEESGDGLKLTKQNVSNDKVQEDAFAEALKAAANCPLPQNEIIYAELWNMSQRAREKLGYERMRDTLVASYKARKGEKVTRADFTSKQDQAAFDAQLWADQADTAIPSNLPGKIAGSFALIGVGDWERQFWDYTEAGMKLAVKESKMTTWRGAFLRETVENVSRLGAMERFTRLADKVGLDLGDVAPARSPRSPEGIEQLLSMLAKAVGESGDTPSAGSDGKRRVEASKGLGEKGKASSSLQD